MKIVVFDSGYGGEFIADFLEEELPMEVERVIDFKNAPYEDKKEVEIRELVERALQDYIGRATVIVLAEAGVTLAAQQYLEGKYPNQKFVGYGRNLEEILQKVKDLVVLTTGETRRTERYKMLVKGRELAQPECRNWARLIDDGELTKEMVQEELGEIQAGTMAIYSTNFLDAEPMIREAVGRRVFIIDFRQPLLRDVCTALGLKGKDGRQAGEWMRYMGSREE